MIFWMLPYLKLKRHFIPHEVVLINIKRKLNNLQDPSPRVNVSRGYIKRAVTVESHATLKHLIRGIKLGNISISYISYEIAVFLASGKTVFL